MQILGRTVDLSDVGPEITSRLHDEWHFANSARALDSNWRVEIRELGTRVPSEILAADAIDGLYGARHLRVDEREFWILENESAARLQLRSDSALIELYGGPFTAWVALSGALSEAIVVSGLLRLHASAMHKDGRSMVFLGPSGRGKSTTLVRALLSGCTPVAEDGCWLDPVELRLFGFDRGLRTLPDAAALIHQAYPDASGHQGSRDKTEFAFDQVGGNIDDVVLTDLVLLRRDSSKETSWSELSKGHAVLSLYESTGIPHTERARQFVATSLGAVVERTACWQLILGATPPTF